MNRGYNGPLLATQAVPPLISGMHRLAAAVMEQALEDLGIRLGRRRNQRRRSGRAFREALQWVDAPPNPLHLHSFDAVCETLNLEPATVRRRILAMLPPQE